jgi:MFS family permease
VPGTPPTFRWDRLTVTCVLSIGLVIPGLSIGLVLGELRADLGLSGVVSAAHGSAFGVGLLLVGTLGLPVIARMGRPAAFWTSCALVATGVTILCLGNSWPVTLAGTALAGFACAALILLMPGIVADHHGEARAAAFAAINGLPAVVGIALSLVVGATIAAGGGWQTPYLAITLGIAVVLVVVGRRVSIPPGRPERVSALRLVRQRVIGRGYLGVVHAVMLELTMGVWCVTIFKEVGGASSGVAATLGATWATCMFISRMSLGRILRVTGTRTPFFAFALVGIGSVLVWSGPGLVFRVIGVAVYALGGGLLYPLAVDRLYADAGRAADPVALGAVAALGSGTATVVGPLVVGVLADVVGLRHAVLSLTALAAAGVLTTRSTGDRAARRDERAITKVESETKR